MSSKRSLTAGGIYCGGLEPNGMERCVEDVVEVVGDTPFCRGHLWKVTRAILSGGDRSRSVSYAWVVYYLGDPQTQLVKIGTSGVLANRLTELRRSYPGALLLATEPGGIDVERSRHQQFEHLRVESISAVLPVGGQTEWFRKEPELMDHIGRVRLQHGILAPKGTVHASWISPLFGDHRLGAR